MSWTVLYKGVMQVMVIKCESRAIAQALAALFVKHGLRAIAIAHVKGE